MKQSRCAISTLKTRIAKMLIAPSFILLTMSAHSQTTTTFPALTSCTSGDLSLVSAALTGGDACNSCTPGQTLTRNLTLGINNKTGSTRTAFAFWGTLEITHPDGTVTTSSISRCTGPVNPTGPLPASYTGGNFGTVIYQCGDALRLTNLYLAWTDASPNSTCPTLNSATINPKCGTLPSIRINAGVNASFVATAATCTSGGSLVVSPFGGTAPFTVVANGTTRTGILAGGSTTFTNLPAGNYPVTITDALGCTITLTRAIGAPNPLPAPEATAVQPTCAVATGTVNITSPQAGMTYTLKQNGNIIHTAINGVCNNVAAGTYVVNASNGTCSTAGGNITVNAQPGTPATPAATVVQPTCSVALGTVNVTSPVAGIVYTLKQSGNVMYTAVSGIFNNVGAGTYVLNASNGTCNANGNNVIVNSQPVTPSAPQTTVVQPNCTVSSGTVNVTSPSAGITYTLKQSGIVIYTAVAGVFNNVSEGTYQFNASNGVCNINGNDIVVAAQPETPAAPEVCIVQPSLCGPSTGSVTILSPLGAEYEYSINNGTTWQSSPSFANVAAGSVTGIKVKKGSCISAASNCDDSDCTSAGRISRSERTPEAVKTEVVMFDAAPVPFKDELTIRYQFDYVSPVTIDVFDHRGILILSKIDKQGTGGGEYLLSFPVEKEKLYFIKLTTNKGSTTKTVISSK